MFIPAVFRGLLMKKQNFLLAMVLCCLSFPVYAETTADAEKNIRHTLQQLAPDETITRIRTTPFGNMYEVLLGPSVIYMSGDGRFILKGDLFDMQEHQNISENERALARRAIFASLSSNEYIEFSPEIREHIIYVFTDVDCGYCRKLHHDMPILNKNGLAVRYLAYPRGGIDSTAYSKLEAVWCADDRQQAMTDAKNGKNVVSKQCSNPVANEYELGQKFGVRGTPAIYKANGEALSGYIPPDDLLDIVKN